jgi:hypothetical protein
MILPLIFESSPVSQNDCGLLEFPLDLMHFQTGKGVKMQLSANLSLALPEASTAAA